MMKWQSRRIGDFIHRVKDPVTLEDGIEYKQVTIRMNYKGVVLRGFKQGCDIKTKNQWRVRSGLFILSRIDARNGAFGIIPEELEGAIVSNDFLAYEIDQAEVDIEFFNSFLQSPIFLEACIKASRGNTNRKRVNENFFLDYQVELPTLSEQQRLITRINKAKDCIGFVNKEIAHQENPPHQTQTGDLARGDSRQADSGLAERKFRCRTRKPTFGAYPKGEATAHR